MRQSKNEKSTSWQTKNWLDWVFVSLSFVAFVCLEGALLYAYYVFLNQHLR